MARNISRCFLPACLPVSHLATLGAQRDGSLAVLPCIAGKGSEGGLGRKGMSKTGRQGKVMRERALGSARETRCHQQTSDLVDIEHQ